MGDHPTDAFFCHDADLEEKNDSKEVNSVAVMLISFAVLMIIMEIAK